MACIINASTSNGLVNSADGSGQLKVQSNGVTTNALAWVNFNGTGTVAIRSSYNVSSITDNGTGDFTVNFATALSDANYAVLLGGGYPSSAGYDAMSRLQAAPTTSSFRMYAQNGSGTAVDREYNNAAVFGN